MPPMKSLRIPVALALATSFLVVSPPADGGGAKGKPSLRFMRTYEAAMLEARIRGVPIFFSRHKDE